MLTRFFLILLLAEISCTGYKLKERAVGLISDSAMVVSAHPLATKAGVMILRKGGNAVDAAIATQFVLAVVYPSAGNIGGGGFMVMRFHDGTTASLDYRERAAAAASATMYLDDKGDVIPDLSERGHLASGVPGTVAGLTEAHAKYGKSTLEGISPACDRSCIDRIYAYAKASQRFK